MCSLGWDGDRQTEDYGKAKGTKKQSEQGNSKNTATSHGTEAIFNESRTQDFEITCFQEQSSTSKRHLTPHSNHQLNDPI
jgi:hypothetical protein